jgi:hypothetical protein
MAPITSTVLGIIPQIIDDERLIELKRSIAALPFNSASNEEKQPKAPEEVVQSLDIEALVALLSNHPKWNFEEQVCQSFNVSTARYNHGMNVLCLTLFNTFFARYDVKCNNHNNNLLAP